MKKLGGIISKGGCSIMRVSPIKTWVNRVLEIIGGVCFRNGVLDDRGFVCRGKDGCGWETRRR